MSGLTPRHPLGSVGFPNQPDCDMRNRIFATLNYVWMGAFVVFALLQFNDPDAVLWMLAYGLAAATCLLAALGRCPWVLPMLVGLGTAVWGLMVASQAEGVSWSDMTSTFSMKTLEVEQAREAGGLLIVALWMAVVTAVCWMRHRARSK